MSIEVGSTVPSGTFKIMTGEGPKPLSTDELFKGKKVLLFSVPGAFTPTCSASHMPGFLTHFDAIKAKGVDTIACTSVNDVHVMKAWAKHSGAEGKILMLADGNAAFAKACGLEKNLDAAGMGLRSSRYSMIVNDGVVTALNVETKSGVNVSGAETILEQL